MATAKIAAAIASIPEKKESLRKAFDELLGSSSSTSSFASFSLRWSDIDDHISAMESTIADRFSDLQAKESAVAPPLPDTDEPAPRPELKSLCAEMDSDGLMSFLAENHRKDVIAIRNELIAALRSAADPAKLVVDAVKDREAAPNSTRTCITLLECIHAIAPEIENSVKETAKKVAMEWKGKMLDGRGEDGFAAQALLQLLISYNLVPEFKVDEVMNLLLMIPRRKKTVELCQSLGLGEKASDLIEKLNGKGRQLDAVNIVYAFNLVEKCPPVPLLKAYIKKAKEAAQEVRKKGNNSTQAQNEAIAKELGALTSVLKAVEEYKLESEYPCHVLKKQIAELQQKTNKKRTSTAPAAPSNLKSQQQHQRRQQQQQQSNKRHRPTTTFTSPALDSHILPLVPNQPQLGLVDQARLVGAYGTGSSSLYNHAGQTIPGVPNALAGQPRSYVYSSEPFAGTGGAYDRLTHYGNYNLPGSSTMYSSSLYPP
ncbi:truncated FRIGIDA-like protein 1 [Typha angustifolia]|uniref:truncated FRIGIDA-like protein 1 n=1 Tax=Typha angustifolia TaxID=59011 RepID=UPI003C2FFD33